ncbi:MAG: T9SS type A sorting domain-containing protein [Calditrichae bacterium]|nr:T9SS type A sorting domain-containing protein [Calditrichia bacterium]
MKKILWVIFLLTSFIYSQQIATSKDSLVFLPVREYGGVADSVTIYNKSNNILRLDSLRSQKAYFYRLKVIANDSVSLYNVWIPWVLRDDYTIEIAPNDSALFIFYDPDLCPVCDDPETGYNFQDSIFIYSNAINQNEYILYTTGFGYTDINEPDNDSYSSFRLLSNYPNPFNPVTTIEYYLEKPEKVTLKVFDLLGREINILADQQQTTGFHSASWNGCDYNGKPMGSGLYFYVLQTGKETISRKMMLIR